MSIALEGMCGYIRTRTKPGTQKKGPDGKMSPGVTELWIDPQVKLKPTPTGPVVAKPADCAGVLYSRPITVNGKQEFRLVVEYPEE